MLTGRTTLTFEDVLKALRDNERMTGSDSSSGSNKLLVADDSGRGRKFHRSSSKRHSKSRMGGDRDMIVVKCYYCGENGHMQVRCPQFREDLKSLRDSKGRKKVDGGEMNVVDNGGDEFLMTKTSMDGILREEKPKWVFDNAASSHICNDRAMFETLNNKGQFGEIKVGSKQMMKIGGVGSVRFKLHDGSVKTALNVKEEKPKWVFDNAASSHICNDRAMFETLNNKGQFGEIKVGSKQMMKIGGVGSVRFKLHDGSVKTALNVKYVPGAARNILSLSR
ncbi:Retrovirus-related Pol polyprotein from transposon TNT 1-94 [Artemisia annua]|uniref:Retrovirus-related Pol polyprotein from transposon TNT 1-94 n=1 Tax=Artemisia annua TaxID=35608 RepID=A0A2U1KSY9_ARTAN|nr:Retrovirus-related Pol polyprotein from transposon TNT 1-94 [Artemisia annua]